MLSSGLHRHYSHGAQTYGGITLIHIINLHIKENLYKPLLSHKNVEINS